MFVMTVFYTLFGWHRARTSQPHKRKMPWVFHSLSGCINVCCVLSGRKFGACLTVATAPKSCISFSCQLMCSRSPMTFTFGFSVCITRLPFFFLSLSLTYSLLHSFEFDTADHVCTGTVFQIPSALWLNFSTFIFIFTLIGICWRFVDRMRLPCFVALSNENCSQHVKEIAKQGKKKTGRSSEPKKNRYNTSGHIVPILIDFSCFIDFFLFCFALLACWTAKNVYALCETKDSRLSFAIVFNFKSLAFLLFLLSHAYSIYFLLPIRGICITNLLVIRRNVLCEFI